MGLLRLFPFLVPFGTCFLPSDYIVLSLIAVGGNGSHVSSASFRGWKFGGGVTMFESLFA